jgi:hypothetical protein
VTKAKLERLIALSNRTALYRADEEVEELQALQAEFEAWEPETATANGQSARYWMNLAQQYADECITLRHKVRI